MLTGGQGKGAHAQTRDKKKNNGPENRRPTRVCILLCTVISRLFEKRKVRKYLLLWPGSKLVERDTFNAHIAILSGLLPSTRIEGSVNGGPIYFDPGLVQPFDQRRKKPTGILETGPEASCPYLRCDTVFNQFVDDRHGVLQLLQYTAPVVDHPICLVHTSYRWKETFCSYLIPKVLSV